MADKARHAFGSSANVSSAIAAGTIDAYDILFLDGDTTPMVGWVDKNGVARYVQDKVQIVRVDVLPTANADENVVYIFENQGYVWNGTQCVPMAKETDISGLTTQVTNLETEMDNKVDANTVQSMIEKHADSVIEVVEF